MTIKEVTVLNKSGLHARPITLLVEQIGRYNCNVEIGLDSDSLVDASSMLNLMTLGAKKGTTLLIRVDGEGEEILLSDLVVLFENYFNEE